MVSSDTVLGFPSKLLDSPARTYVRGEHASDADITQPHNPTPRLEIPAPSQWHVHLELRPEQLMILHRLGFTNRALAWRAGMRGWQPLRKGTKLEESDFRDVEGQGIEQEDAADIEQEDAADIEQEDAADIEQEEPQPMVADSARRGFLFVRGRRLPGGALPLVQAAPVSPMTTLQPPPRSLSLVPPPPARHPHAALDELLAQPVPGFPERSLDRARSEVLYEPPLRIPEEVEADGSRPFAPLALVQRPMWPTHPQVTTHEKPISIPPPAVVDVLHTDPVITGRALWLGASGVVILSACVAALVSSFVWNLQTRGTQTAAISVPEHATNTTEATVQPAKAGAELESSELPPAHVSVDDLPILRGAAPVTAITSPGRERSTDAADKPTTSVKAAAPSPKNEANPGARAPSRRPQPSAPVPLGPPDRNSIARAVGSAAGAARSCGPSPESGQVQVRFSASGSAQAVQLVRPFSDGDVNACVLRAMSRARVTPFVGDPVTVRKVVAW